MNKQYLISAIAGTSIGAIAGFMFSKGKSNVIVILSVVGGALAGAAAQHLIFDKVAAPAFVAPPMTTPAEPPAKK